MEILKIRGLKKNFGSLQAVGGVDLSVHKNEIHAVIGPNGAGKTTLFNLVCGDLKPDAGQVFFKGQPITGVPAHHLMRLGMARSFQITHIFPHLSVFENVMIPVLVRQKCELNLFRKAARILGVEEDTFSALRLIGLDNLSEVKGHALSHGDKKRLELAMILASKPELLLLDEPTAGMSSEETGITVNLIKQLSAELGITIVFTEHDMKVVFSISNSISVLHQGMIIAEGLPENVRKDKRVIEAYIGEKKE